MRYLTKVESQVLVQYKVEFCVISSCLKPLGEFTKPLNINWVRKNHVYDFAANLKRALNSIPDVCVRDGREVCRAVERRRRHVQVVEVGQPVVPRPHATLAGVSRQILSCKLINVVVKIVLN